jgi:hypothetical protein
MSTTEQTWFTTPQGAHVRGDVVNRETVASARDGVREQLTIEHRGARFRVERRLGSPTES